ncbi:MAG TPA: acyltransferase, partial [Rudaea sp.]|nr:acyltransferase [Rudaea sp.]
MNTTNVGSAIRQRNVGLQALRGLAAGAVVVYHAAHFTALRLNAPWLESIFNGYWGYYGVMVFFVLSGFLMESAVRHYGPSKFLFHRFLRLFPTYWLLFLCLYLAQVVRLHEFSPVPWSALTLLPLGEMYRPLGVEWTLLYEVLFYGVCTLLCFRRRLFPYVMVLWLAIVIDATYRHHQFGTVFQPIITQIPFSLWNVGFIFGAMAGVINRISRLPDAPILWLIGLALVSMSIAAPQPLRMFIASVGIASIVVALSRSQSPQVSAIGMPLRVL